MSDKLGEAHFRIAWWEKVNISQSSILHNTMILCRPGYNISLHIRQRMRTHHSVHLGMRYVFGQLPRRTISHRTGFGPDEWFYSVVVVLVGSCPGGE